MLTLLLCVELRRGVAGADDCISTFLPFIAETSGYDDTKNAPGEAIIFLELIR